MKTSKVSARDYVLKRQKEMSTLTKYLNGVIKDNPKVGWHYKEFGKQVEKPIIEFLVKKGFLVKNKFI